MPAVLRGGDGNGFTQAKGADPGIARAGPLAHVEGGGGDAAGLAGLRGGVGGGGLSRAVLDNIGGADIPGGAVISYGIPAALSFSHRYLCPVSQLAHGGITGSGALAHVEAAGAAGQLDMSGKGGAGIGRLKAWGNVASLDIAGPAMEGNAVPTALLAGDGDGRAMTQAAQGAVSGAGPRADIEGAGGAGKLHCTG